MYLFSPWTCKSFIWLNSTALSQNDNYAYYSACIQVTLLQTDRPVHYCFYQRELFCAILQTLVQIEPGLNQNIYNLSTESVWFNLLVFTDSSGFDAVTLSTSVCTNASHQNILPVWNPPKQTSGPCNYITPTINHLQILFLMRIYIQQNNNRFLIGQGCLSII